MTSSTPTRAQGRYAQHFLIDDPLDLMVPQDHRLAHRTTVSISETAEETWIVGRPGSTFHQLVMATCASAGFTPNIGHYSNDWDTGTALVAARFGVCVVSRLTRWPDLHPVVRIPLAGDPPTRHLAAVTKAGAEKRQPVSFSLNALSTEAARLMHQIPTPV